MLGIIQTNVPRRAGQIGRVLKRAGRGLAIAIAVSIAVIAIYFLVALSVAFRAQSGGRPCYPPHLEGRRQSDYAISGISLPLVSRTERKKVVFCLAEPPVQDFGNEAGPPFLSRYLGPQPVAAVNGKWRWQISHTTVDEQSRFPLVYWSVTAPRGWMLRHPRGAWHTRFGFRWDDNDGYYVLTVAFKWIDDSPLDTAPLRRRAIRELPPAYPTK